MSAIDGCRLPSNASKEYSGTKEELQKKYDRIKKISSAIIEKHKRNDALAKEEWEADNKKHHKLEKKAQKILDFLQTHEDRRGAGGEVIQSNVTDNDSGKIKSPQGIIQGYNGITIADSKEQVIIATNAYGSVAEGQFFSQMLEMAEKNMCEVTGKADALKGSVLLGDTAYFSEDNLQVAKKKEIVAVIPDEQYRNRDELLKDGVRREGKERFDARYFKYNSDGDYYTCPNGKILKFRSKVKLRRSEGQ
jgi:hypothetical protein